MNKVLEPCNIDLLALGKKAYYRVPVKAVLNWKRTRTFARAQQAPLFLN